MAGKDYYHILGVQHSASEREIRGAFRKLARAHHPDHCPDDAGAEARFGQISEAYEVLSDAEKRRQYDRRRTGTARVRPPRRAPTVEPHMQGAHNTSAGIARPKMEHVWNWFDRWFADSSLSSLEPYSNPTASVAAGRGMKRSSETEEVELPLTPEEARRGGTIRFTLTRREHCEACRGNGATAGVTCTTCRGDGRMARSRPYQVSLPPNLRDGMMLRFSQFSQREAVSDTAGELLLRVHVRACW